MTSVFVPVILIISVSVCESQSTDGDGSAAAQHTLFTQVMRHTLSVHSSDTQMGHAYSTVCEDND